jgi:hypothetical protein
MRSPYHHGAGNLIVPGLMRMIEGDPEKPQAGHRHRQEAPERADDRRLPIDCAPVQAHDSKIEHRCADGRAAHFPHDGAVCRQRDPIFQVMRGVQHTHDDADEHRIEQ